MASDCFSSSAVVTPETITYEPGAHPPKSNVGQITTATCGTSASDLFYFYFFWLTLNLIVRYDKYVL